MEYLKVWTSFRELLEPLTDAEKGRLFTAMLEYAETGAEPQLSGNERYVWPSARQSIKRASEENERMKTMGKKGGRPKPTETYANLQKPTETYANLQKPYKDKEKEKDKDNIKENPLTGVKEKDSAAALDRAFDKFWAVYPRHTAKKDAKRAFLKIAPDDTLLTAMLTAIQRQKQTEQWSEPRYIPHPATWLNGRRWEDEPSQSKAAPVRKVSANQYQQREYDEDQLEKDLGVNDLFAAEWKGEAG